MNFRPRFITFDCHGTLIRYRMGDMARRMVANRLAPGRLDAFIDDFSAYRLDEVMGDWKPYVDVVKNALRRTCRRHGIEYHDEEGQRCYDLVPTWGPHADVVAPLQAIAGEIPLVILSNAANEQIDRNVASLAAPFHRVYTAEDARAYKPRLAAFEYMLDQLGCGPNDILHVSSSLRYDLMSADDLGIRNKVFVNRGHDRANTAYHYTQIRDLSELPALVGLSREPALA